VARPYTQRFCLKPATWPGVGYQVPAGHRVVVASVSVLNNGVAGDGCALWIAGVPVASLAPGAGQTLALVLRVAAYAGEQVELTSWGANVGAQASGFIFEDLAGPIGKQQLVRRVVEPLPADAPARTAG
jgi:hypothetical protein